MSVEVKTPTHPHFDHAEFRCGEKQVSGETALKHLELEFVGSVSGKGGDSSFRAELGEKMKSVLVRSKFEGNRFPQPSNSASRKRRFLSQSSRSADGSHHGGGHGPKKRRYSKTAEKMILPTKFLLGGNINDPLNLNSLCDEEVNKAFNEKTPQSSPVPTPAHRRNVELVIPRNINDPLNLNQTEDDACGSGKFSGRRKKRHKYRKKNDSLESSASTLVKESEKKKKHLAEALKIEIEGEVGSDTLKPRSSPEQEAVEHQKAKAEDKIVSPVIPQLSSKSRKRRQMSLCESRPETLPNQTKNPHRSDSSPGDGFKGSPQKKYRRRQSQHKPTHLAQPVPKSEKSARFKYGNYNRYYGYRNLNMDGDHRLDSFKREWFEGKDILDIGCNVGHLTLLAARDFQPRKIIGVDIDGNLIAIARKNIRHYLSHSSTNTNRFPTTNVLNYGPIRAPLLNHENESCRFPLNVMFVQGNYVLETDDLLELQKEEYDVILAFSLTKWVHLNWGDEGLKRMFKRVYRQLRSGGKFILEPQAWPSYKKRKKLTETIEQNYLNIRLTPEHFTEYLLSEDVGFSTSEVIDVPFNKSKGFQRPILMFTKPKIAVKSPCTHSLVVATKECGINELMDTGKTMVENLSGVKNMKSKEISLEEKLGQDLTPVKDAFHSEGSLQELPKTTKLEQKSIDHCSDGTSSHSSTDSVKLSSETNESTIKKKILPDLTNNSMNML